MNTKVGRKYNDLEKLIKEETGWHLARVKCFCLLICALIKLQSVSFVKLAQGFDSKASNDSNLRRIQRFFAKFTIDQDLFARLVFKLLPEQPPYLLSMDRTNWKFGQTDINILMISVSYKGVGIPLVWKLLRKKGNSNTLERQEVLNRYIGLFGIKSIEGFMADREFIGEKWFEEIIGLEIPFHIRIKANMKINVPSKGEKKAFWLFNHLKVGTAYHYPGLVYINQNLVYLSGIKTFNPILRKHEFVIIASLCKQDQAMLNYKERWQIETMFRAMKSSGFNIEDTHLTNIERISKLIVLVTIAFIWAYRAGIDRHQNIKPIRTKKHGKRAYSFFKYGLIELTKALVNICHSKVLNKYFKLLSCT
ncbi:MAG: IS4 family transposase [bacterium]|nr:IS4 family transposase [bacterium]